MAEETQHCPAYCKKCNGTKEHRLLKRTKVETIRPYSDGIASVLTNIKDDLECLCGARSWTISGSSISYEKMEKRIESIIYEAPAHQ